MQNQRNGNQRIDHAHPQLQVAGSHIAGKVFQPAHSGKYLAPIETSGIHPFGKVEENLIPENAVHGRGKPLISAPNRYGPARREKAAFPPGYRFTFY